MFWTSESHLYARDTETGETLQLDSVVSGAGEGAPDAVFQTASANGQRVFFTDSQRLTAQSKAGLEGGVEKADLYVFELNAGKPLSGTLTDLTPEGTGGESAGVLVSEGDGGGVLSASEDGTYVYFVANGDVLRTRAARGLRDPGRTGQRPPL